MPRLWTFCDRALGLGFRVYGLAQNTLNPKPENALYNRVFGPKSLKHRSPLRARIREREIGSKDIPKEENKRLGLRV